MFDLLPPEVIENILKFLSPSDLQSLAQVDNRLCKIIETSWKFSPMLDRPLEYLYRQYYHGDELIPHVLSNFNLRSFLNQTFVFNRRVQRLMTDVRKNCTVSYYFGLDHVWDKLEFASSIIDEPNPILPDQLGGSIVVIYTENEDQAKSIYKYLKSSKKPATWFKNYARDEPDKRKRIDAKMWQEHFIVLQEKFDIFLPTRRIAKIISLKEPRDAFDHLELHCVNPKHIYQYWVPSAKAMKTAWKIAEKLDYYNDPADEFSDTPLQVDRRNYVGRRVVNNWFDELHPVNNA